MDDGTNTDTKEPYRRHNRHDRHEHDRYRDGKRRYRHHHSEHSDKDGERRHHHKRSKHEHRNEDKHERSETSSETNHAGTKQEKSKIDGDTSQKPSRDAWMIDPTADFDFGGIDHRQGKADARKRPEPTQGFSDRELNLDLKAGKAVDELPSSKPTYKVGDAGSNWRMMKLRRVHEVATEENRPLEEVALERYESMEAFHQAQEERKELDKRRENRTSRASSTSGKSTPKQRVMFSDSRRSSVERFKRPDGEVRSPKKRSPSETPDAAVIKRIQTDDRKVAVPAVFTPPVRSQPRQGSPPLSQNELNRLNARALKARMMDADDADELEHEYNMQLVKFQASGGGNTVNIVPTLDSRGQLYDLGKSGGKAGKDEHIRKSQGIRAKKEKIDTHDALGERVRYENDDDVTLDDLVRQERFGGGPSAQKDMDVEFAQRIARDAKFSNNLHYIDDNVEKLSRQVGKSDYMKKQFAIQDYRKTKSILENCDYCYQDDNRIPPAVGMISLGTRTYLALPDVVELTPGHCQIVPLEHTVSSLECEDDTWDEIRNFMKCLMRMHAEYDRGVIFMETVKNLKAQKHAVIEVIPLSSGLAEDAPAFFKEALLQVEGEWSQHKKVIDTRERTFRRSMVSNLPYFHVWFNPDGGYGHVIENESGNGGRQSKFTAIGGSSQQGDEPQLAEDGNEFPIWFGKEVIGGMLDLGPEKWRKPKRTNGRDEKARIERFNKAWKKWDWTAMLDGGTLR